MNVNGIISLGYMERSRNRSIEVTRNVFCSQASCQSLYACFWEVISSREQAHSYVQQHVKMEKWGV